MATPTYDLIDSTTLASAASSVTFSSIPQTYRDLVVIINWNASTAANATPYLRFNGDTANYKNIWLRGNGVTAASSNNSPNRISLTPDIGVDDDSPALSRVEILDYSVTNKRTSLIYRTDIPVNTLASYEETIFLGNAIWQVTTAVSTILIGADGTTNFATGSTFYLFGIAG